MLRYFKVLQHGSACHDSAFQVVDAESLEILHAEVFQQFLACRLLVENPFIEFEHTMLRAEETLEVGFFPAFKQYFFRLKVGYQFLYIVVGSLRGEEFSGGNVEECHSAGTFAEVDGGEEVVLLVVQYVVRHCHSRRDEFCYAPLHEFLRELRVLQLVAYRYPPASPDELRQVCVECVMRESRHLCRRFRPRIVSLCQSYAENAAGVYGVVAVCLIEVAAAEEQQRVGVFSLQGEELLHHRRQSLIVFCHVLYCILLKLWIVCL